MKLYYSPGACSLAGHIVAAEGGLDLELERVDLKTHKTEGGEDFYAINPKGYVPTLKMDDGSILAENAAILPFLGGKTGAMPKEGMDYFHVLEWIGFVSSELHKSFSPLFRSAPEEYQAKMKEKISSQMKLVEDRLTGDYLMGSAFTPADAYLFVVLRWAKNMQIDLSHLPRVTAFKTRMEARPAVQKAMQEEGL